MRQILATSFVLILMCTLAEGAKEKMNNRPTELRGSKEQRVEQNKKAISLGLEQILTDQDLLAMAERGALTELINKGYYVVDRGWVPARRLRKGKKTIACSSREKAVFIRSHVVPYIDLLARDFFKDFDKKLKMSSGARSLERHNLMRTKGSCYYTPNAARADEPLEESLHVRGIAIDISRRVVAVVKNKSKEMPMSRKEVRWMRQRLIADKIKGVEFYEENQEEPVELETESIEENVCYHIVVFPR